ncbi:MAG: PEP-utilizing enzyme [Thermoleophilia bacterium]
MFDRSISSLRTLRPGTEFNKSIFWFRDDLHQPYVISPMGMTTIQAHHAWGYHVAAAKTSLPSSHGGHVKIYKGRVYLGFALIDDPAEVEARAPRFAEQLEYCLDHWDEFYRRLIREVMFNLDTMNGVDTDKLIYPHLLDHLERAEALNRRNWEIHFELMYLADAVYFHFEEFCRQRGLEEKDFVIMLRGFDSMPTQTDEEMWGLAKAAEEQGLKQVLLDVDARELLPRLREMPEAAPWLDKFGRFLDIYGNRVVAAHLDVSTPTWREDPAPVLDTIKGYFPRMESGWDYHASREAIHAQREQAIQAFEQALQGEEEKAEFRRLLKAAQGVYAFQEDHGFYIDQGSTAVMRNAVIACGKRLFRRGLLESIEDVVYLTYPELLEIMKALVLNPDAATYHYRALVPDLVRERKEDAKMAEELEAPLTIGNVPEKMTDPIGIKVFGIIDDILHPKGERQVEQRLEGFPGAPGVVEGPARVVTDYKDFQKVKAGEILVCPYTGTAWTPLFMKIAGVVTDTGGMLTHAAIAAREYGIPSVVGTWNATNSIGDGDIIRVDGNVGVVEILRRVGSAPASSMKAGDVLGVELEM